MPKEYMGEMKLQTTTGGFLISTLVAQPACKKYAEHSLFLVLKSYNHLQSIVQGSVEGKISSEMKSETGNSKLSIQVLNLL